MFATQRQATAENASGNRHQERVEVPDQIAGNHEEAEDADKDADEDAVQCGPNRDAAQDNARIINQFFAFNTAKTVREFRAASAKYSANPWATETAVDDQGEVYFGDGGAVPTLAMHSARPGRHERAPMSATQRSTPRRQGSA